MNSKQNSLVPIGVAGVSLDGDRQERSPSAVPVRRPRKNGQLARLAGHSPALCQGLTTIILAHFHRFELKFEPILVFEDQAEIPRLDLARLSDVSGEMISPLESSEDLQRNLLHHVA